MKTFYAKDYAELPGMDATRPLAALLHDVRETPGEKMLLKT